MINIIFVIRIFYVTEVLINLKFVLKLIFLWHCAITTQRILYEGWVWQNHRGIVMYFFLNYWHCDFVEVLKWSFAKICDYANLTVNPDMHFVQFTFVNCYGGIKSFVFLLFVWVCWLGFLQLKC